VSESEQGSILRKRGPVLSAVFSSRSEAISVLTAMPKEEQEHMGSAQWNPHTRKETGEDTPLSASRNANGGKQEMTSGGDRPTWEYSISGGFDAHSRNTLRDSTIDDTLVLQVRG
jgi:hypothetical protein